VQDAVNTTPDGQKHAQFRSDDERPVGTGKQAMKVHDVAEKDQYNTTYHSGAIFLVAADMTHSIILGRTLTRSSVTNFKLSFRRNVLK